MSVKRLRIRVRPALSDVNIEWIAGHEIGIKAGIAQGETNVTSQYVNLVNQLRGEITQLRKDVSTACAATRINEETAEKYRMRVLQLEQETALLRQPMKSDWLSVPPFMMPDPPAVWTTSKTGRHAVNYGGWPMIVRPDKGRINPIGFLQNAARQGGIMMPELSERFLREILNQPSLLTQTRVVPMRAPGNYADDALIPRLRPPGNPIFHWDAAQDEAEDGDEMVQLTDMSEHNLDAVREAFRTPLQVSSEFRSPEAEEGIRRASAEGVTDEAGGHSHTIELGITVDDSELRDVITRVEELGENISNAGGISTQQFQNLMERLLHLERMAGVEVPEESTGEANVNSLGGAVGRAGEDQD